jgi:hypothetical protein
MQASALVKDFAGYIDSGPQLLGTAGDRITVSSIHGIGPAHRSLTLVRPGGVEFYATTSMGGNPQLRARFQLGTMRYDLSVTDVRMAHRVFRPTATTY